MLWEEISAWDFDQNVDNSASVCILPIAVLEKHGDHLPLGTDMYIVRALAEKAAKVSTSMVFPYYFYGQIAEARHVKGTLAASHRLIMDSLLEMCDEIHRNGFKKIIILSGHGGNGFFMPFFAQWFPGLNRPYAVYTCFAHNLKSEQLSAIQSRSGEMNMGGHAGFLETSLIMYLCPELVHMQRVKVGESESLDRLKNLQEQSIFTGFDWYAKFPHHFAGDPSLASAEHGSYIFDILLSNVVEIIKAVKEDDVSLKLIKEYNLAGN